MAYVTIGYMLERDKIRPGLKLKLLRQLQQIKPGTVALVDTVKEETWSQKWAFSVRWENYRLKNRYSLCFGEGELEHFELLEDLAESTDEVLRLTPSTQLLLPFTQVHLYRGAEIVGDFEMWAKE